jgi:hypothetical protein
VTTYKVNSLERGLAILRVVREGEGPVRNQDVVVHTRLPKATVSRLMHTLTAMGYLRRIDQGSYVLGEASARSGRAMLDGLRLQRYAADLQDLLAEPDALVWLEARIAGRMVPVFRWSRDGAVLLASGVLADADSPGVLTRVCFDSCFHSLSTTADPSEAVILRQLSNENWCHRWDASMGRLFACTGVHHSSVGHFVLSARLPQPGEPSEARIALVGAPLLRAARAISNDALDRT